MADIGPLTQCPLTDLVFSSIRVSSPMPELVVVGV